MNLHSSLGIGLKIIFTPKDPNSKMDLSTNIEVALSLNPELMHKISIFLHNVLTRNKSEKINKNQIEQPEHTGTASLLDETKPSIS